RQSGTAFPRRGAAPSAQKQLITEQTMNNMLSWRNSGFSVDATVRVDTIREAARIGRYMIRCPIVFLGRQ
ncbi:hypothetical protein LCGC14_0824160, partial [marine sediment metagenome]